MRSRAALILASVCLVGLTGPPLASARPERIRPGHSYYSDSEAGEGEVRDIGQERNYEEVYQSYRYYEAVYDEAERVVTFREYVRGDPVRTEEYRYDSAGRLVERVVREPGRPPESTRPSAAATACAEPRPQACTREYRPVCGEREDGSLHTYGNACDACADPAV